MQAKLQDTTKPRLLFVDDEKRVLNSMRVMFRRQFDLFLASHGAEALDIVKEEDIDVIIADHRMPRMTGVEVLSAVRTLSPRTVRILLTGYADLDAVEGSINDSEVFRFLTKPCAPDQLRATVELAATVARETSASIASMEEIGEITDIGEPLEGADDESQRAQAPASGQETAAADVTSNITEHRHENTASLDRVPAAARERTAPQQRAGREGFGVVVFTDDDNVLESVQKAGRGRVPIFHARNIVKVVKILTEQRPGVLVTDIF